MAKRTPVPTIKDFTNLDEVLDKMLELGFFGGHEDWKLEARDQLTDQTFRPQESNEFWYSNGVIEVKIFKGWRNTFELCNYRGQVHRDMVALFELAEIPKL